MSAKHKGMVFLVGAGPGDPGLLTLRAKEVLENCTTVVYDYLANPSLLNFVRPEAGKVYVGKQAGKHSMNQEQISRLLVRLAGHGHRVARLKGGDPFVFGRGGEEALALADAAIPFEVVPGISSGVAALSYAGIPLTHRGLAASAVFATGHEDPTKPGSDLNDKALAGMGGTLVFFMGVEQAGSLCRRLMAQGLPAGTPAAVIQWGTHPRQRTLVSSAGSLEADLKRSGITPPALLVLGKVVSLRRRLAWFEKRPLFGKRVVVTRSRDQAGQLADKLAQLGAEILPLASIRIEALSPNPALKASFRELKHTHWLVFTSQSGVEIYFEALRASGMDARALQGVKVAAIGPATARCLAGQGIQADLVPKEFVAEGLLREFLKIGRPAAGLKVVLARAMEGRDLLPRELRRKGVQVQDLALYRTLPSLEDASTLLASIQQDGLDLVTFTSSSTAGHFRARFTPAQWKTLASSVPAASIGPVTTATLKALGWRRIVQAKRATMEDMVQAARRALAKKLP